LGSRSHTTFKKRQKEQARTEKAREKLEKRQLRKVEKSTLPGESSVIIDSDSDLNDSSLDVLDLSSLDTEPEETETEQVSSYPRPK
jgi:hypothetical protein